MAVVMLYEPYAPLTQELTRLLQDEGHDVIVTPSLREIAKVRGGRTVDLYILDVTDTDRLTFEKVTEEQGVTGLIFQTTFEGEQFIRGKTASFGIKKPFTTDEFLRMTLPILRGLTKGRKSSPVAVSTSQPS